MTALHYAAESGHVKVLEYLDEEHASINIKAHDGVSLIIRKWQTLHVGMEWTYKIEQKRDNVRVYGHIISWCYTGV